VQRWRRHIGLKASYPFPGALLKRCRELGADDRGERWQRDTHFEVACGELKLREERPGRAHLIQAGRVGEADERERRLHLVEVRDSAALSAALADVMGIRAVVVKRRRLLLWRDVRIHIDRVDRLGTYIELEAVAPADSDVAEERRLLGLLRTTLGIVDDHVLACGYADLLAETHGSTGVPGLA
jgi:adenylate cyclase class IV